LVGIHLTISPVEQPPPSFPLVIQLALFYLPVHALSLYGAFQPNQCSLLDPSGGHPGNLFSILLITSAL
jgi:hypothetical protein